MTKSWRKAIMTRSRLKHVYLKTPTPFNWMKYKMQRNICVFLNRQSRREYCSKLDCKNQQTVKSFLKSIQPYSTDKVKSSSKIILIEKEKIINGDNELAKCFGKHFSDIYQNVQPFDINTSDPISDAIDAFKIHPSILKVTSTLVSPNDSFDFQETSLEEVVSEITNLKSTCAVGADKIPDKILKLCTLECATFLVNCFNNTMKTSNFPSAWKSDNVVPVPKTGVSLCKSNYRPISILPAVSKVFERIMQKQINTYFKDKLSPLL